MAMTRTRRPGGGGRAVAEPPGACHHNLPVQDGIELPAETFGWQKPSWRTSPDTSVATGIVDWTGASPGPSETAFITSQVRTTRPSSMSSTTTSQPAWLWQRPERTSSSPGVALLVARGGVAAAISEVDAVSETATGDEVAGSAGLPPGHGLAIATITRKAAAASPSRIRHRMPPVLNRPPNPSPYGPQIAASHLPVAPSLQRQYGPP